MEVIRDEGACPRPAAGTVVTIGVYDGVHLGHQALIRRVRRMGQELGAASAVVTFDRHPATVVRPESAPRLLTDLDQRLELLAAQELDYALVLHFDQQRAAESAEEFVREVLAGCLRARAVVVGHDFHFGHRRGGNVALLQEMGADLGFDVLGINLLADGATSTAVSSTRIRQALLVGDVVEAGRLLGRPHEVRGVVQRGDARGRELGFPTANVAVPEEILLPADGIYAGWYERPGGQVHPAAISIGRRPTFYPEARLSLLEAYLLDFDGDLYGEPARVRFTGRLRDEIKFDSVQALVGQMSRDVDDARNLLAR
ncbi:MAG: bifunctional riboflavin kinase/FAD synthetase [Actinobacteria bacterium]|nr:bifunctional riboflavin kinase/FAD synthetase [Actinomycetota bacterium]MBW3651851.1 bifunctional riboflavin kinase/FAD synthetase [Actinomycetota bacterium]